MAVRNYEFDPLNFYSLPGFACNAMLNRISRLSVLRVTCRRRCCYGFRTSHCRQHNQCYHTRTIRPTNLLVDFRYPNSLCNLRPFQLSSSALYSTCYLPFPNVFMRVSTDRRYRSHKNCRNSQEM